MDPNANIEEQRDLAQRIINSESYGDEVDDDDARRLAELVLALDRWLSSGGFKPGSWKVRL